MPEIEIEAYLPIAFDKWSAKDKVALIRTITQGGTWEFYGKTLFAVSPRRPV